MSAEDGKRSPGEKINKVPATVWNNAMDAGQAWAAQQLSTGAPSAGTPRITDIVKVRNDTGQDMSRGEVLCLDDFVLTDLAFDALWFSGKLPTTAEKPYGVLLDPIPHQASGAQLFGRLQMSGVCIAKIDKISDAHKFAHIASGDNQLQTDTNGQAQILFKKEVESQWWAVVRLSNYRSGGGHAVIRFRVISLVPYMNEISSPCEAVIAEVLSVSCQSSGVSVGDEVTIYDPSNCWFNVPIEVLEGANGQAVLMEAGVYEQVPDCIESSEEGCWWLVQHLCCTEELYAN